MKDCVCARAMMRALPSARPTPPPPPTAANVKHYVFNNEETDRSGMSSNVPDRAAKELYYKPFGAAVDAGVGSAMCSCE